MLDHTVIPTHSDRPWPGAVARLDEALEHLLGQASVPRTHIRGVGAAAPGPLDFERGVVVQPPNLSGWRNVPLRDLLQDRFSCPVYVDNDCNAGALGEAYFGGGQDVSSLCYITLSTGVGGGLILNRRLHRGWDCLAGEVGHFTIDSSGPRCRCGQVGCLELFTSGPNLVREMKERVNAAPDPVWSDFLGSASRTFSAREVLQAARQGSAAAREVLQTAIRYLALGISIVNYVVNPERFILGGGIMQTERAQELIVEPVIERLQQICRYKPFRSSVVKTGLGSDSVIWGCAALAQGKG